MMPIFSQQFKTKFMRVLKRVNDICGYLVIPITAFLFITIWTKYPEQHGAMFNLFILACIIMAACIIIFAPLVVIIIIVSTLLIIHGFCKDLYNKIVGVS